MATTSLFTASSPLHQRWVHPAAWWVWALGLATAASRTTDPLLLASIIAVAGVVVSARKPEAPWSRSFSVFLKIGVVIVLIRIVFQVLLGTPQGTTVLFTLPQVPLPEWLAGIRLGGAFTAESLVAAAYDGFRLATVLACVGAASSLASPYRLLKAMPAALYEIGVSVVVALSFAPALVSDVQRIRTAHALRGRKVSGLRGLTRIAIPVFSNAMDRSISLAAAMDSRGYGRTASQTPAQRRITGFFVVSGLLGIAIGIYGLLDSSGSLTISVIFLVAGLTVAMIGFIRSGRRNIRTTYRPDPWGGAEWVTSLSGATVAATILIIGTIAPDSLSPTIVPLSWPQPPPLAFLGILVGLAPAFLTPTPPRIASSSTLVDDAPLTSGEKSHD